MFSSGRKKLRGVEVENCLFCARSRRYRVVSEQKDDHRESHTWFGSRDFACRSRQKSQLVTLLELRAITGFISK